MKKFMIVGLLLSFGASAKNLCFQIQTYFPVAVDISILNSQNQTYVQRLELVPDQYFCQTFSNTKTKRLSYLVHGMGPSCIGEIKGSGTFNLVIADEGCKIFKSKNK